MNKSSLFVVLAFGLLAGLAGGCGKKEAAPAPAAAVDTSLPGSADVMAALGKKDYEAAMAALGKIKSEATDDQQTQVTVLTHEVKSRLLELEATDPKAAEALAAIRAMTVGR